MKAESPYTNRRDRLRQSPCLQKTSERQAKRQATHKREHASVCLATEAGIVRGSREARWRLHSRPPAVLSLSRRFRSIRNPQFAIRNAIGGLPRQKRHIPALCAKLTRRAGDQHMTWKVS